MTTVKKSIPAIHFIIFLFSFSFSTCIKAQLPDSFKMPGSTEIKVFYSKILGEKRRLFIQTPSRMSKYDAYPVLYVLDGEVQTVLITGQVQYLSESYKIIPNLIVVGIENTNRTRDLTPTHSIIGPGGKPGTSVNSFGKNSGGGENFLRFIKQELMPYIELNYHPAPYRILAGHSLGALMALHCMVNHPDYFNAWIAISPSLQWDNEMMLKEVNEKLKNRMEPNRILFFSDANEDTAFHRNQLKLDSLLQKKNIPGLRYKRMFYPEETHISEPVKAFYDGIRFVYPNWHLPYNSAAFRKTMSSVTIKNHFVELSKLYGYNVLPLHDDINQLSRFLRNDPKKISDAIDLLQMNAINYPSSSIVQETLGDTFLKAGDSVKARTAFQKALLLEPSNEGIQQKIKNIQ